MREKLLLAYAIYLVVLSFFTFLFYCSDKRRARKGKWRIPEKVLLLMSFFGGAFGGILAMKKVRHKTSGAHWYFTAINVLGILVHLGIAYCIAFVIKI